MATLTIRRSQRRHYIGPTKTKRVRVIALPAALVDLLRAHRDAMKGSAGFGHPAFPMLGVGGVGGIGARGLQAFATSIALPPRKVRPLRWDVEIDLSVGMVCRAGEEALKLTPEAVAILQKRRDAMRGFAAAGDLLFSFRRRSAAL